MAGVLKIKAKIKWFGNKWFYSEKKNIVLNRAGDPSNFWADLDSYEESTEKSGFRIPAIFLNVFANKKEETRFNFILGLCRITFLTLHKRFVKKLDVLTTRYVI